MAKAKKAQTAEVDNVNDASRYKVSYDGNDYYTNVVAKVKRHLEESDGQAEVSLLNRKEGEYQPLTEDQLQELITRGK